MFPLTLTMQPEDANKSLVLIFAAIGAGLRVVLKPPKTPAQVVGYGIGGTAIGFAATPYINRMMFGTNQETLPLVAICAGLVAISLALGLFNYVDKHREDIVRERLGIAKEEESTDTASEGPNG